MLAALPQPQVKALYADRDAFAAGVAGAPSSLSNLRRLLVDVRAQGWASEDGEVSEGLASIAVPVLDAARYPVAAVTVTYPVAEQTRDLVQRLVVDVTATARLLSRRLGGG